MGAEHTNESSESGTLAPKMITDRFSGLEEGDVVFVNDREAPYKVVNTDTYSVMASSPDGHEVTISQNLQTGGWVVHEDIWHVETEEK